MLPSSSSERRASRISIVAAASVTPDPDQTELPLPVRLDYDAARSLHRTFLDRGGATLVVDGTAVTFCGALAAQVLIAAAHDTKAAGNSFVLKASTALRDDLSRLGVMGEFYNLVEVTEC